MTERAYDRLQIGVLYGAAAYLVGFVVTTALELPSEDTSLLRVTTPSGPETLTFGDLVANGAGTPGDLQWGGWVYHAAHFGWFEVHAASSAFGPEDVEVLAAPSLFGYLLPLVLLGGAGFLAVRRLSASGGRDAAATGAHVAVGYAAVAVASLGFLTWAGSLSPGSGGVAIHPHPGSALVVTGLLYPAIVGALGGYVRSRT